MMEIEQSMMRPVLKRKELISVLPCCIGYTCTWKGRGGSPRADGDTRTELSLQLLYRVCTAAEGFRGFPRLMCSFHVDSSEQSVHRKN